MAVHADRNDAIFNVVESVSRRPRAVLARADVERTSHLSIRDASTTLGVTRFVLHRARLSLKPVESPAKFRPIKSGKGGTVSGSPYLAFVGETARAVILT
jgi:hypothetical protein